MPAPKKVAPKKQIMGKGESIVGGVARSSRSSRIRLSTKELAKKTNYLKGQRKADAKLEKVMDTGKGKGPNRGIARRARAGTQNMNDEQIKPYKALTKAPRGAKSSKGKVNKKYPPNYAGPGTGYQEKRMPIKKLGR